MSEAAIAEAPEQTEAEPQATEATPQNEDQEERDALLAEFSSDGTEADAGEGTEGDGEDAPSEDEDEQAAIDAKAERLAEKKAADKAAADESDRKETEAKAKVKSELDGKEKHYRETMPKIHGHLRYFSDPTNLPDDIDGAVIQPVLNEVNSLTADQEPVVRRWEQREIVAAFQERFPDAEFEWDDVSLDRGVFIDAVVAAAVTDATKGMFTKAERDEYATNKVMAKKRLWRKNPELLTSQTNGASDRTPNGGRDNRSDNEILSDPNTPVEKLMEIRARQRGE